VTQSGVRNLAFGLAVLISASLDTLITATLVQRVFAPFGTPAVNLALIGARSIQVSTLFLIFESVLLRFWGRHILGRWAYLSTSGNYGLAEITLAHGEFRYRVQLYKTPGEVAGALEGHAFVLPMAHVSSKLSKYEDSKFETDYHIEYTDGNYPQRKGLLTLLPTADPMVLTGNWYTMHEGAAVRSGRLDVRRGPSFLQKYVHNPSPTMQEASSENPTKS
jgi:hypothetical protein